MQRLDDDARREWYAQSANLSVLDALDQPRGFEATRIRAEVDDYLRAYALAWTRWQTARRVPRRPVRLTAVAIVWLAALLAQTLISRRAGALTTVTVAMITTAVAYGLWVPLASFGNAARSMPDFAARAALAGAALGGGGGLLIIEVGKPPTWPGALGMILIATGVMAGIFVGIMNTFAALAYAPVPRMRKRRPRAAILSTLIDLTADIACSDKRNDLGERAHWLPVA